MKEVVIDVLGGTVDVGENLHGVDVRIVDFDNGDELEENYGEDILVITVLGGLAEVYKELNNVSVKIIDWDNRS